MRDTHLESIDLNLLRTIQPLLEERHVSRAAKRSFLSQPAMSRALDRLRDAFGDPLLVRSGRVYERTPRGERVLREIEPIMRRLQAIVRDEEFTPAPKPGAFPGGDERPRFHYFTTVTSPTLTQRSAAIRIGDLCHRTSNL